MIRGLKPPQELRYFRKSVVKRLRIMQRQATMLFLATMTSGMVAQNLIPNPSFEDHSNCPTGIGQLWLATPWQSATEGGTPDYLSACAPPGSVGVPYNVFGSHLARTGSAYAGLWTRNGAPGSNYREYLGAPLTATLQAGVEYHLTFCIVMACPGVPDCQPGTDGIGAYLSAGPPLTTGVDDGVIPVIPQFDNALGNVLLEEEQWVVLSGSFVALGGESHITIGNFRDDASTTGPSGYYFLDDVCLSPQSSDCAATTNIERPASGQYPATWPVIFSSTLYFPDIGSEGQDVRVLDMGGRTVATFWFHGEGSLDLGHLRNGTYMIERRSSNGTVHVSRVLKLDGE